MRAENSFLIAIRPSFLNLCFFITVHLLALLSILLIDASGMVGLVVKGILVFCVAYNFRQCLTMHNSKSRLYFKPGNLIDLNVDNRYYRDLRLSGDSYFSRVFNQLILIDAESGERHCLSVFADAIDAGSNSRLKASVKLMPDH